jgi:hypothetical protein
MNPFGCRFFVEISKKIGDDAVIRGKAKPTSFMFSRGLLA